MRINTLFFVFTLERSYRKKRRISKYNKTSATNKSGNHKKSHSLEWLT